MMSIFSVPVRIYLYVLTVLLGLVMGSALNCLAYRMVSGEKWSGGRSKCPKCGHTLGILDLIPLFSWLFLGGKCRYCKAPISARYPLTESILGLCFGLRLWRFGVSLEIIQYLVLVCCLFCLSLIDFDTLTIPDRFLLIPAVVRVLWLLLVGGWKEALRAFVPALVLGGGILLLSLLMDKVLKKESMGGGDIKLLFMLGLFFDLPCCLLLLIFSCVVGLVFAFISMRGEQGRAFPFGPSISIAAVLTCLFGTQIISWYINLFFM